MPHIDGLSVLRGEERGGDRYVLDVAAGQLELLRHEADVYALPTRGVLREHPVPYLQPVKLLRHRELNDKVHAANKGVVHVLAEVGGQNDYALVLLHLLQQVAGLDVGVTVVRVLHLGTLAEQRVGLVEEENGVAVVGLAEYAVQVLLSLADVLAYDGGKVDLVQVKSKLAGYDIRRHGLARTRRAHKQRVQALPKIGLALEAPVAVYQRHIGEVAADLLQLRLVVRGQHYVVQLIAGLNLLCQSGQALV